MEEYYEEDDEWAVEDGYDEPTEAVYDDPPIHKAAVPSYRQPKPPQVKAMPRTPFNEGVPTIYKTALPGSFHRGIICQQPHRTQFLEPLDQFQIDVAVVMGQEIPEQNTDAESESGKKPNKKKGSKKNIFVKKDTDVVDSHYRSLINLPAMQYVNRDQKKLQALSSIKSVHLPEDGSANDLSDDEAADMRDFEIPFNDLCEIEDGKSVNSLTAIIKDGMVFNSMGNLLCADNRIAPKTFLHCHICDKRGFPNVSLYNEHMFTAMHRTLRELHMEKLKAGLVYIRAGAKKAEIRLAMGVLRCGKDPTEKMTECCDICSCKVFDLRLHKHLPQHKLTEKFSFPECCGKKFRSRVDFEDHRTTPSHLRELYKERVALMARLEGGRLKGEERYQSLPEYLRLLKANCITNDDDNTANLTPYDPDRPNVVKLIKYHGSVQCVCCGDTFQRQQLEQLYEHVHSIQHYEAAVLYSTQRERDSLQELSKDPKRYPACVRERSTKVVKIAEALVKDGHSKAEAGGQKRILEPPTVVGEDMGVLVVRGEPLLREDKVDPETEVVRREVDSETAEVGGDVEDTEMVEVIGDADSDIAEVGRDVDSDIAEVGGDVAIDDAQSTPASEGRSPKNRKRKKTGEAAGEMEVQEWQNQAK